MGKKDFIQKLSSKLKNRLGKEEAVLAIRYYDELISDRLESGEFEKDIIESLGSIDHIVRAICIESLEKRKTTKNLKSLYLSFKNLVRLATTPFLLVLAIVFAFVMVILTISLVSIFFGFAASLITILISTGHSIILLISGGGSFFAGLFTLGANTLIFGLLLALTMGIKDLIFYLINRSISLFTRLFKERMA